MPRRKHRHTAHTGVDFSDVSAPSDAVTLDEREGIKNELSFTQSKLVEAEGMVQRGETLRLEGLAREAKLNKANFELMRDAAILQQRLKCLGGAHVGNEVRCLECDRVTDDGTWKTRPPVRVSIEDAPPNTFIGPFVLLDQVERANLVELEEQLERSFALGQQEQDLHKGATAFLNEADEKVAELENHRDSLQFELRWKDNRLLLAEDLLNEYQQSLDYLVTEYELNADENTDNLAWVNAWYRTGEYFSQVDFREDNGLQDIAMNITLRKFTPEEIEALDQALPPLKLEPEDVDGPDADEQDVWERMVQYGPEDD